MIIIVMRTTYTKEDSGARAVVSIVDERAEVG